MPYLRAATAFPPRLLVLRTFALFFLLPAAPVENSQPDRRWSPVV